MEDNARRTDLRNAALCALLTLIALLLTTPWGEVGFNDDAPYCHMVKRLVETGRLAYNGWAAVMLLPQIYWAALWVKICGFSFTLVHLTTVPFALGVAVLLYGFYRAGGLKPPAAVAGTLAVTLSPLFLPNGATLMTDVPGLCFLLLSVRAYAAVLEEGRSEAARSGMVCAGTLAALVGGTTRQVVWLAPLLLLPYLYVAVGERRFRAVAAVNLVLSVVAVLAATLWFRAQPYSVSDSPLLLFQQATSNLERSARDPWLFACRYVLAALPLALATPYLWERLRAWPRLPRILVPAVLIVAHLAVLALAGNPVAVGLRKNYVAPWDQNGNMVNRVGVLNQGLTTVGERPPALPEVVWFCLSVVVWLALVVGVVGGVRAVRSPGGIVARLREYGATNPPAVRLLSVYLAVYTLACLPRSMTENAFDRYLLPGLPLIALLTLRRWDEFSPRRRAGLWAGIILFALYGIAATHDYRALSRALAQSASRVEAAGVPRTRIRVSFEYDLWTQIEAAGYVNNPGISTPAGAYRKYEPPPSPLDSGRLFWEDLTPTVRPAYYVTLSPQSRLAEAGIGPIPYRCWLPPFRRFVYLLRSPEAPRIAPPDTP